MSSEALGCLLGGVLYTGPEGPPGDEGPDNNKGDEQGILYAGEAVLIAGEVNEVLPQGASLHPRWAL